MTLAQLIYGACSAAFLGLIALVLVRGRINGRGLVIVIASALTAMWAADLTFHGCLPEWLGPVLDAGRLSAWLIAAVLLLGSWDKGTGISGSIPIVLSVSFSAIVIGTEAGVLVYPPRLSTDMGRVLDLLHAGLAVGGLLAIENILRNVDDARRRKLWPLCLALGGIFAFELFIYANVLMAPTAGAILLEGRGVIGVFAVPLIALTIIRNREWGIDIHMSRTVVLHTAALITTGIFFLGLSATAVVVRNFGGSWGPALQTVVLLGSAIVLVFVLGARELRIRLKQFISRHFFSNRFDYRAEWLRFVDTVSDPQNSRAKLPMRVVRALGQIIDSPGGALWRLDGGAGYALDLSWNLSIEHGKYFAGDDPFVTRLQAGEQIQIEANNADHPFGLKQAWLAVPLLYKNRLFGFVVLLLPHTGYLLDEEVIELLRTAGKQAGSYLAEEQASQALFDAQMITEFGKRFAFVVHDMKNLGGQLSLTLANAQNYLDNPDYREDMLLTLQDAVKKLDRLVGQLRYSQSPENAAIEADSLIADVVKEFARLGAPVSSKLQAPCCSVRIEKDQFRSILHHLLNNAREAGEAVSPGSALPIIVSSRVTENKVLIDVVDKGAGMEEDFIREHLFRPFKSTKVGGLGIGAYQTRELLRMAGGDLAVISKKGVGTIMRITLPVANPLELIPAA
jgi:putative PEP-CTERM system histidine kinase